MRWACLLTKATALRKFYCGYRDQSNYYSILINYPPRFESKQYAEWGRFITTINNVAQQDPYYWFIYVIPSNVKINEIADFSQYLSPVGVTSLTFEEGTIILWWYHDYHACGGCRHV